MKTKLTLLIATVLVTGGTAALAQSMDQAQQSQPAAGASANMAMTRGEVRKIDAANGKITLKHEAITNLDMPPMTMVFRVEPADLLKDLQPGDKVQFHAENASGAIVVTHIQKGS